MMDGTTFNTRVTADELRAFVERVERLEAEARSANDLKKEVYAEAKGRGYDAATIRKVVAERKKDPVEREEAQAVFELYWEAL